jgi:hypothetical protein
MLYPGIEIPIIGLEGIADNNISVYLPDRDSAGNPIKDNPNFYIHRYDGKYYLNTRDGNTLDFEAPLDANGDSVYELVLSIEVHSPGADSVGTRADLLLVIENSDTDPAPGFGVAGANEVDGVINIGTDENTAGVATLSSTTIDGKTQDNVFVVGTIIQVEHQDGFNPQSAEEAAALNIASGITSSISGVDADKFLIRDTMWGTQIFFAERPFFSSPSDADGNNVYEFDFTKLLLMVKVKLEP